MARGRVVEPLEISASPAGRGTRIRFQPDPLVLGDVSVPAERIEGRLRELAWLCPLLAVRWQGQLLPGLGGLRAWVGERSGAVPSLGIRRTVENVEVDLALGWAEPGGSSELLTCQLPPDRDGHARGGRASCYKLHMKHGAKRRAGATATFSVSVDPETKRALRALADADFDGNLSAAVSDLAEEARRRLSAARLLRRLGVPKATADEARAIEAEISSELAAQGGRRRRPRAA